MLHRCIEGERVGDDGGEVVGVDCRHTMMAPTVFRRHRERRGESPPSSSSLTFSLVGRRVSPLVHGLHGGGEARAPPRLDLSLFPSVSAFPVFGLSPFLKYLEIRNSH